MATLTQKEDLLVSKLSSWSGALETAIDFATEFHAKLVTAGVLPEEEFSIKDGEPACSKLIMALILMKQIKSELEDAESELCDTSPPLALVPPPR